MGALGVQDGPRNGGGSAALRLPRHSDVASQLAAIAEFEARGAVVQKRVVNLEAKTAELGRRQMEINVRYVWAQTRARLHRERVALETACQASFDRIDGALFEEAEARMSGRTMAAAGAEEQAGQMQGQNKGPAKSSLVRAGGGVTTDSTSFRLFFRSMLTERRNATTTRMQLTARDGKTLSELRAVRNSLQMHSDSAARRITSGREQQRGPRCTPRTVNTDPPTRGRSTYHDDAAAAAAEDGDEPQEGRRSRLLARQRLTQLRRNLEATLGKMALYHDFDAACGATTDDASHYPTSATTPRTRRIIDGGDNVHFSVIDAAVGGRHEGGPSVVLSVIDADPCDIAVAACEQLSAVEEVCVDLLIARFDAMVPMRASGRRRSLPTAVVIPSSSAHGDPPAIVNTSKGDSNGQCLDVDIDSRLSTLGAPHPTAHPEAHDPPSPPSQVTLAAEDATTTTTTLETDAAEDNTGRAYGDGTPAAARSSVVANDRLTTVDGGDDGRRLPPSRCVIVNDDDDDDVANRLATEDGDGDGGKAEVVDDPTTTRRPTVVPSLVLGAPNHRERATAASPRAGDPRDAAVIEARDLVSVYREAINARSQATSIALSEVRDAVTAIEGRIDALQVLQTDVISIRRLFRQARDSSQAQRGYANLADVLESVSFQLSHVSPNVMKHVITLFDELDVRRLESATIVESFLRDCRGYIDECSAVLKDQFLATTTETAKYLAEVHAHAAEADARRARLADQRQAKAANDARVELMAQQNQTKQAEAERRRLAAVRAEQDARRKDVLLWSEQKLAEESAKLLERRAEEEARLKAIQDSIVANRDRVDMREKLRREKVAEAQETAFYQQCEKDEKAALLRSFFAQVRSQYDTNPDPNRFVQPTASFVAPRSVTLHEAVAPKGVHGYAAEKITRDPRYRVHEAIVTAGLQRTAYAQQFMRAAGKVGASSQMSAQNPFAA